VTTGPHDPADLRQQIAANQATIDRLNRDLAKKSGEVRIIQQISAEITSTLDLDEVLGIVLRAMDDVLGFRHSMILLASSGDTAVRVAATRGYAQNVTGAEVKMGDGVIGVVAQRRKMMRVGALGASVLSALKERGYVRKKRGGRAVEVTKPLAGWVGR